MPKQYRQILGEPVIRPSLATLAGHAAISAVQPVIHPEDAALYRPATAGLDLLPAVPGGASRQASVCAGLEALEPLAPDLVLVHDAARPFASEALISRAIAAAQASGAAVPVIPVADTVKTVDAAGAVTGTIDRAQLRLVQTPQAFGFTALLDAHRAARAAGRDDFTDDAALAEWAGLAVTTFEGEAGNVKLTTNEDFTRAEASEARGLERRAHRLRLRRPPVRRRRPRDARRREALPMDRACPVIPTPTWFCMRWSTPSSARWPTAISACISRRAIRNGAAPPPTGSSPSRSSDCASAAGASPIST